MKFIFNFQTIRLFALILVAVHAISCNMQTSEEKAEEEAKKKELSGKYKSITINDFYTFDVPVELMETDKLNPLAQAQFISLKHQFGILVMNEDLVMTESVFDTQEIEFEDGHIDTNFIDAYLQFQLNNLKNIIIDYDSPQVEKITVSGCDARSFEMTGDIQQDNIRRLITGTAFAGKTNVFYMYMFYEASRAEQYKKIKEHILNSFKLDSSQVSEEILTEITSESSNRPKQSKKNKPE